MNDRDIKEGTTMLTILKDCIAAGDEALAVKHIAFMISNTRGQAYRDGHNEIRKLQGQLVSTLGPTHGQFALDTCSNALKAINDAHGSPMWTDPPTATEDPNASPVPLPAAATR